MSETIEWRLVLRDEANRALDTTRAKLDAMSAEATKAAFGVRHVEDSLGKLKAAAIAAQPAVATVDSKMTTLQTSAAAASRSVATVGTSLTSVQGPAQRAWVALNTVDGKMLTLSEQAKALQQKMGPASAAISGVSAALGQQAGEAGKAINAVGQLVAAFGAGGPFGLALAAGALAVGALTTAWDDAIKAQDKAMEKSFAAVTKTIKGVKDASAALREMQIATGAFNEAPIEQRREVDAQAAVDQARAKLEAAKAATVDRAAAVAAAEGRVDPLVRAVGILSANLVPAQVDYVGEIAAEEATRKKNIKLAERQLEITEQTLALAKEARRVAVEQPGFDADAKNRAFFKKLGKDDKPKSPGARAGDVPDGDTLEDWKQRAFERAAAEQKAQEKLAADRYARAIDAATKRTDAEAAIEKAAAEKSVEQRTRLERDFVNLQIDLAEKAQIERQQIADRDAQMYTGLITSASATIAQGIADGVNGQEDALASTLSALSRQAGGFITLEGGKLVAAGIASELLAPGNPLGLAQIGGGAALIAAGAAVTAGGPAVIQAALGGARGGGGGGSSSAARSTGASSSRSSSSSSGEPSTTVINITYGGPTGRVAEEVAKATFKAGRNNDKRGRR